MTVTVQILGQSSEEISWTGSDSTVLELMKELNLSSQAYIAAIDDEIVPVDHPISEGNSVLFVKIMSGG